MAKVLVICGPTATGKTKFGLEIARELNGEIVSADSRQVYEGKNLIYGKDLPTDAKPQISDVKWKDRYLKFYEIEGIKIWLYDVIQPNELFSVALWKECVDLVIADILSRNKLPIVVGGTGLYLKALQAPLDKISVAPNPVLRDELANKSTRELFDYLNKLNPERADSLNNSDRNNPRRLIRAIEISNSPQTPLFDKERGPWQRRVSYFQIGLTASREELKKRIEKRVVERIQAGAVIEDPELATNPEKWQKLENEIVRKQLTWFQKQPNIQWFDVQEDNWQNKAKNVIKKWYNS